MDLTSAESKATYAEIKTYVMDKYQIKVSSLNIAQSLQLQSLFLMKIKERRQLNYRGFPLFILKNLETFPTGCTLNKETLVLTTV